MTWTILIILFFSLLSSMTTVKLPTEAQSENLAQDFVEPEFLESQKENIIENVTDSTQNSEPDIDEAKIPAYVADNIVEQKVQTEAPEITPSQNESTESVNDEFPQLDPEPEFSEFESGPLKTIGVAIYSEIFVNNPFNSIDWGKLTPGGNQSIDCYLKNTGDDALVLTLETDNWTPSEVADYMTLTWDYDGQSLDVDEIIKVTLTLIVSETICGITEFFFDIVIIGHGT
jgi:hypothetical protein